MRYTNIGKWFSLAVFSLGIGGFFAFLVGMSRAPGISEYLPENYFQHALVGHVDLAILCWLMISAIVLWIYYLKEEVYPWSYWLAVLGVDLIVISAVFAIGEPSLNNYVPILDSWVFFLGLGLFFTAFCVNAYGYLKIIIRNSMPSDPIMSGVAASLLICVVLIAAVLVSFVLLGGDDFDSQAYYERLFWTPGHIQQFLNGSMLIITWYSLLKFSTGEEPKAWGFLANLNKVLVASSVLLLGMLFFFDPLDRPLRIGAEIIYAFGLGLPLFFHIVNILRQYKFKAGDPASVGLLLSILVYLYGIFIAYGGFGDDTRVPAHYHGAVTALTLALMAFGYNLFREHGIKVYFEKAAKIQPYIYGIGMLIFISGLFVSGLFGAPRKTYGTDWTDNPIILTALGLMGVGTLLAVIGGIIFVLYAGTSILKGVKEDGTK
jgi:heme/copper-type cytochrome/quinol oxidase subunit 1